MRCSECSNSFWSVMFLSISQNRYVIRYGVLRILRTRCNNIGVSEADTRRSAITPIFRGTH